MAFSLTRQSFDRLASRLPHSCRRRVYRRMHRSFFWFVQDMNLGRSGEYSLGPFYESQSLFIHIPRTGGVSFCRALFGGLGAGHTTAGQYLALLGAKDFSWYYKVAVIRNPYDRLHSAFEFLGRGGMNEADRDYSERVLARYSGFDDFVLNGLQQASQTQVHFVPQWRFVLDPRNNRVCTNRLIEFDELERGFEQVAARLGKDVELPKPNRRKAEPNAWHDILSDEAKRQVRRIYLEDFERFGYDPEQGG